MSNILAGFNAGQHQPRTEYDLIPDGWYLAQIDDSETKPTKAGTGHYLELTFVILDGPAKDRRVWDRLNLDNPNPTAVAIAQESLASICHAVAVLEPKDPAELHDKPLQIKIGTQPAKGSYAASNVVKGYRSADAGSTGAAPAPKPLAEPSDDLPF